MVMLNGALIPSLPPRSVTVYRTSSLKRLVQTAAAIALSVGLLSPASATQRDIVSVFPHLPAGATAVHAGFKEASLELTSRRPWLAPVGHRQPQLSDVLPSEVVSTWERQQQEADRQLDQKLIICRGC
jgi:hypothetical protein